MKKIYLLMVGSLLASAAYTQAPTRANSTNVAAPSTTSTAVPASQQSNPNRETIVSETFNFVDLYANFFASSPVNFRLNVFPDSTPNTITTSGLGNPFIHSVAQVYDLTSPIINQNTSGLSQRFDVTLGTTIDSIRTYGRYEQDRFGTVDTLIFRVIPSATGINLDRIFFFTGDATDYPTSNDTTRFAMLNTDSNTFMPPGVMAEYKVAIDPGDTLSNGVAFIETPAGIVVNRLFAVTVDFKPGKSFTPFVDTIGFGIGGWSQFVTEMNGSGTFQNYTPGDLTGGYYIPTDVRYNIGGGWNGRYIPYLAYGAGWVESINMDLVLSHVNSISLEENKTNGTLFQNFPNPTNGFTTVKYSLENQAQVNFEMIDITGKRVISMTEGNKTPGTHTIELNTDNLNAGIYFYSIIVDGQRISKKMTITK